ncbi:Dimethylsulfide dehydrogenase subunit gamma [bacterium HR08]|nr:Dimethylsulfide dehydrogenase subunit gamma [bacterium HR08]
MRRTLIIVGLIGLVVSLFLVGSYYALFRYRTFPPAADQPVEVLDVPYLERSVELSERGAEDPIWQQVPGKTLPLAPQVTAIPWGKASVPEVTVAAFHNGERIFFRLQWRDPTEDRQLGRDLFSDACAIMLPLVENPQPNTIMMGFLEGANIWAWKAARDAQVWKGDSARVQSEHPYADYYYPFEPREVFPIATEPIPSAVEDLVARGVGTLTPRAHQRVQGRGFWKKGMWTVILTRALAVSGAADEAALPIGGTRAVAFAVWDGAKGDRGARKSITGWVRLRVWPTEVPAGASGR